MSIHPLGPPDPTRGESDRCVCTACTHQSIHVAEAGDFHVMLHLHDGYFWLLNTVAEGLDVFETLDAATFAAQTGGVEWVDPYENVDPDPIPELIPLRFTVRST